MKRLITIITVLLFISCSNYGDKLSFDGTDVYYKDGITKEQAQKLGEYLKEEEFTDGSEKSVQLIKDETTGNIAFRMVVGEDNEEGNDEIFKMFAKEISKNVFNGKAVDFHICNNSFETIKAFPFNERDKLIRVDGTDVLYTNNVTESEAQKLANYLKESDFTDGTSKTIQLDKDGKTYLFRMVVIEGVVDNEENEAILKAYGKAISINVFDGKPLIVHMCDDSLTTLKEVE